ncbi:unnamed protein product [Chilo suppressalis]|uniref:DUF4802 domain-containing protein n=1 Tax=Chilo suppressalis TaxID=168631 RepID=A0ABN8L5Z3_CHISP|nr:unnamed protein product [Chilo suppressalis]
MAAAGTGAVFFLGSRAHYQVLQQPETRSYDVENGNTSTETIYQNPSVQELWPASSEQRATDGTNWSYDNADVTLSDEKDKEDTSSGTTKSRTKRRQSEATLCERDNEMRPALLNDIGGSCMSGTKPSRRNISLLSFLSSLARRKRRMDSGQIQYLQHLESALNVCSYRESCRCLECQSRYFECDESEGYSSDDGTDEPPRYFAQPSQPVREYDDDDEVFVDTVPGDNTSTDMLLESKEPVKMSVSSDEVELEEDGDMQLEVAAGTPVLLNYLLTHPITCAIQ